jgi:hypothetical protein
MEKEIIVLAKSYKHSPNYCIAGIDINTGEWIRPISENLFTERAVPPADILYEDGNELNLLDVVRIKFKKPMPTLAQPENYLYDSRHRWVKLCNGSLEEIIKKRGFDYSDKVFSNSYNSLTENELPNGSLLLLKIQQPIIHVEELYSRKRVRLSFYYNGISYKWFAVSDIELEKAFIHRKCGNYPLANECIAVFSLTEKYERNGKYYKMAAQLFVA